MAAIREDIVRSKIQREKCVSGVKRKVVLGRNQREGHWCLREDP